MSVRAVRLHRRLARVRVLVRQQVRVRPAQLPLPPHQAQVRARVRVRDRRRSLRAPARAKVLAHQPPLPSALRRASLHPQVRAGVNRRARVLALAQVNLLRNHPAPRLVQAQVRVGHSLHPRARHPVVVLVAVLHPRLVRVRVLARHSRNRRVDRRV